MIDRQGRRILIECDSCNEVFTGEEGADFSEVWREAKNEGWRTKKIGSDWVHGCEKCGT